MTYKDVPWHKRRRRPAPTPRQVGNAPPVPELQALSTQRDALVLAIAEQLSRRGFGAPTSRHFANQYVRQGINEAIGTFIITLEAAAQDAQAELDNKRVMDTVWANLKPDSKQ